MQDIRKYIDILSATPQVGDAIDLEFGESTALISTTIEKIDENSVTVLADDKALKFISDLEEACGCEMEQEPQEQESQEQDHEVNMGKSQMYHAMKNAKAVHDMLQKVSERQGIEGWVASKLTKASDYLKVVKDYLEYEMVQAGFDKNEQDVNEAVDKSALEAWYNKYKNYEGSNGDELPAGMLKGYIDTGILSDGAEINEYNKVTSKYGQDAVTEKGLEPFYAMMPITKSMHEEFMKVMGVSEIDEDNCTEAAKILGDDIVGFGVDEGGVLGFMVPGKNPKPIYKDTDSKIGAKTYDKPKGAKEPYFKKDKNKRNFGQTFEAKYKGKTVKLSKPIRTGTDEPGKFKVYVKDPKTGNVKMVRFGHQGGGKNKDSKTMRIKKSNPARRKSFRARHNCSNPGPRTKARYWSCRAW